MNNNIIFLVDKSHESDITNKRKLLNYLKNQLSYKNQLKIEKALKNIDLIFYFVFKPDKINLQLRNTSNKVIAKYEWSFNLETGQKLSNKIFNEFMIRFYNRYFLSTAQITLPGYSKEDNIKIYVNKKSFDPISSTIKGDTISYVIPNIPRHINSWAQIITSNQVSEKHYFQGEDFYLDRLHRKINWETHIDNKRKAMFTLRDKYLTSEIVLLNMKGDTLKDLDPEIKPISFKKIGLKINRTKKGTYKIISNTEGKYPFVIKNENYPTQWPQTIEFSDSSTYTWKYKGLKNRSLINMQLSKKSLPITWSLNTLLPGAGMFYQNKRDSYKAWIASVNLVSYLIFLNSSITNYNDFKSSRTNYLYYQNQFMQNSFLSDKNKTLYYYSKTKDYKKEFQINLLLTLTINVLSNLYLHEGFLREKKFRNWFK